MNKEFSAIVYLYEMRYILALCTNSNMGHIENHSSIIYFIHSKKTNSVFRDLGCDNESEYSLYYICYIIV